MIFNHNLTDKLTAFDLREKAEILNQYVYSTFLQPNDLNINPISSSFLQSNKPAIVAIYSNLSSEILTNDLDSIFMFLFNNVNVDKDFLLYCSKTRFLSLLVASLVYGFIKELSEETNSQELLRLI